MHFQTPLTRACHFGHKEVVRFLLQEGATQHPLALIKAIDGLHQYVIISTSQITIFIM